MRRLSRQDALEGSLVSLSSLSSQPDKHTRECLETELPEGEGPGDSASAPNMFSPFQAIQNKAMKLRHRSHPSLFRGDSSDAKSSSVDILHPFLSDSCEEDLSSDPFSKQTPSNSQPSSAGDLYEDKEPPSYLEAETLPAVKHLLDTETDWSETDLLCQKNNGKQIGSYPRQNSEGHSIEMQSLDEEPTEILKRRPNLKSSSGGPSYTEHDDFV